jgi:hypothetical protein
MVELSQTLAMLEEMLGRPARALLAIRPTVAAPPATLPIIEEEEGSIASPEEYPLYMAPGRLPQQQPDSFDMEVAEVHDERLAQEYRARAIDPTLVRIEDEWTLRVRAATDAIADRRM